MANPRGALAKARLAAEVIGVYGRVRLLLWRRDISASVAALRADGARRAHRRDERSPLDVAHLLRATVRTLAWLPTDSRCLMRSLVALCLLARYGVASKLVIGVRPGTTLLAHAWIERDGCALLPDGGGRYARLVEL